MSDAAERAADSARLAARSFARLAEIESRAEVERRLSVAAEALDTAAALGQQVWDALGETAAQDR